MASRVLIVEDERDIRDLVVLQAGKRLVGSLAEIELFDFFGSHVQPT